MKIATVAGAGGFIGSHLTKRLLDEGLQVRAVDIKRLEDWEQVDERSILLPQTDLRIRESCHDVTQGVDEVYCLAADMGGMGYIETHKVECMLSVLISVHMLQAAERNNVGRFFYSSSACVYRADKQDNPDVVALKEEDAYPASPEDGYGWEKLFSERLCRHFREDLGLATRVARFHNVYGTHTAWTGGREKAPAAISRKVAEAKVSGTHKIDIWGDGNQTRSFMWIDDCVEGITRITRSDIEYPINLGSTELVSINELVSIIEDIAGIELEREYDLTAPKGVAGRNSDNTLLLKELNWEPSTPLRTGLERTYAWVEQQVKEQHDRTSCR